MKGISVYCSSCRSVFSEDRKRCKCGQSIKSMIPLTYVVIWHVNGAKRRKFINESRKAAVNFLRSIKKDIAEGKYIDTDPGEHLTLGELRDWYLKLPEVKAKRGYVRIKTASKNIVKNLGTSTYVKGLNEGRIESYQFGRRVSSSTGCAAPATINLEVSTLKNMINRAIKHNKFRHNPISQVKNLPSGNGRGDITQEDFEGLLKACDESFKGVLLLAGYTGMRQMEVLDLKWQEVDINGGEISLPASRTKSYKPRTVPFDINDKLIECILEQKRKAHSAYVFTNGRQPYDRNSGWRAFDRARRAIGRRDITFHDLRHLAINRLTKAGYRPALVMDVTGHSTTNMHMHYQKVSDKERHDIRLP